MVSFYVYRLRHSMQSESVLSNDRGEMCGENSDTEVPNNPLTGQRAWDSGPRHGDDRQGPGGLLPLPDPLRRRLRGATPGRGTLHGVVPGRTAG